MIELAKHIEVLLLENDCVIVPGLGGFIAHNRQAEFKESENRFTAPSRTIGFNPQLVMNDGLLVQTYMQAYNTDFPDATRKIEKIVSALKEQLYQKGEAMLPNVGTLYYTMNGTYVFEPAADEFFTPYLYGLNSLSLSPLHMLKQTEEQVAVHQFVKNQNPELTAGSLNSTSHINYKRTFQRVAQHTVGIAAAILLFFLLSVPVENTYMDDASYASLSAESMFDAIRGRSVATQLLNNDETDQVRTHQKTVHRTKNNVNTLRPVCVKSETIAAPAEKPATKKLSTRVAEMKESTEPSVSAKPEMKANKTSAKNTSEVTAAKKNSVEATATAAKALSNQPSLKTTSKGYYLIVASLPTSKDAQKQLKYFQSKGFTSASVLESGNRHRIALFRYSTSTDAYKKLKELRSQEDYKNAWVFASK